jgi:hypothetical protein
MTKREALARELASAQAAIAPARAAIANIEARLGELNRREVAIVREISGIALETFEAETEGDIADFAEAVGERSITALRPKGFLPHQRRISAAPARRPWCRNALVRGARKSDKTCSDSAHLAGRQGRDRRCHRPAEQICHSHRVKGTRYEAQASCSKRKPGAATHADGAAAHLLPGLPFVGLHSLVASRNL